MCVYVRMYIRTCVHNIIMCICVYVCVWVCIHTYIHMCLYAECTLLCTHLVVCSLPLGIEHFTVLRKSSVWMRPKNTRNVCPFMPSETMH